MMEKSSTIHVLELRRLLYELKDRRPDICVRFRLIGEMWQDCFSHLFKFTENGIILVHPNTNQYVVVSDLYKVVQFEIESAFQMYKPHFHYNVEPLGEVLQQCATNY